MSGPIKSRRGLALVDPPRYTPQFIWKRMPNQRKEVFCEGVPLTQIAERFETPVFAYSQRAIEAAFPGAL